ncbi:hypothetical protein [Lysinibacillus sp. SGAir0095]|uniref:hypothetical protein n=1 Tax=Lysinibacillus sp. SGAir0095 TaxID=2070463 RepID=UPI001F101403|nr:hypothetical protein [Lysinibacillus sp. SGAir0095]
MEKYDILYKTGMTLLRKLVLREMQLTIRGTGQNVKILSYLLAKNPNNLYEEVLMAI